uniref:Putative conserved secreted protein n=1 Tax=Ixodes ricinus TaxID=34613 RepID=A0A131XR27_IXORI
MQTVLVMVSMFWGCLCCALSGNVKDALCFYISCSRTWHDEVWQYASVNFNRLLYASVEYHPTCGGTSHQYTTSVSHLLTVYNLLETSKLCIDYA